MIILDCEQGSAEWIAARLGIPTASQFSRIVTPTGMASASQRPYIAELCAEWALAEPAGEWQGNEWAERGKMLEPDARRYYAFERGIDYREIGLAYRDETRKVAASPDGISEDGRPLELKCPMPKTHLLWLSDGELPREHAMQVQGQMWVMGATEADFLSYCPGLPPLMLTVKADPGIQRALDEQIPAFVEELDRRKQVLRDMGVVPLGEQ